MCGCKNEVLEVIYRFSTKELDHMMKKVEDATTGIEYETEADISEEEEEEEEAE